ncbi:DUF4998 domain-containing protein [Pedobacter sp. PLR]|uniref:DUF4998 domain-containing protein n=1 Tax=Pedobacter sp. PLR TaxID=2994465 RepID=UPI002245CFE0|nr:DUF4998 domain-containing protein [Pedobacter sp. PLR]MCX2453799.1 DUF4998 domain-containing protein [Pedobacter sp. PLR]
MMMKSNYLIYLLLLVVAFSFSCKKKHVDGVDTSEKPVVVGKATSLISYPGRNRVKLSWKIPGNSELQKFKISWGSTDKESKEMPLTKGIDSTEIILNELLEGDYTFSVVAIDIKGNVSEKTTVSGHAYGDKYEAGLVHREIKDAVFNEARKTVLISWNGIGSELTGMDFKYNDAANVLQTVSSLSGNATLANFKLGNTFEYRSVYQPAGSIDAFYTAYKSASVIQPNSFLGADWALYTPVKKIHLDNEAGLQTYSWTSYKSACTPVICADYSYDSNTLTETFQILNTKSNRSEIRVEDNYSTGSRQFSGYLKFDAPLNDESLVQIFGSTSENATQLMIRGFSENGGTLKISNSFVLATGVHNKEVHINVIHLQGDAGDKMIVYIDGEKKFEKIDAENATNYMKYGCYGTMKTGKAIVQWRDVKFYKNGKAPD